MKVGALLIFGLMATMKAQPAARFLALGDSYTIGEGVAESERWPVQLARALRAEGAALAEPEIIARTGWTTDELDAAITERAPKGPYALVTLLVGVNNQYRGRSIDEYRDQFRALLVRAVRLAGGKSERVIVVSIPDWGVTPFNTSRPAAKVARDIDAFNLVGREEARRGGARWVDITDLGRAEHGAVVADGLHPSAAMYSKWVARLMPVARGIFRP